MKPRLFDSYEDSCAFLGIATIGAPDLSWVEPKHRKAVIAQVKLFVVHEAHNKANNFTADWTNGDQRKYCAWQWIKADDNTPSGLGFSYSNCDSWHASTNVGSRLSVGTSEEAIHIAKTYPELYQDWYFFEKEAMTENVVGEDTETGDKTAEGGE
jgi:hypothetical protein